MSQCKVCGWFMDGGRPTDCPMVYCGYDDAVRALVAAHIEYESWDCSRPAFFLPFPRDELETLSWRVRAVR